MDAVYLMAEYDQPYIAGPMRGLSRFNFDAFYTLETQLTSIGVRCFNPARHDEEVYPGMRSWPGFERGSIEECPEFSLEKSLQWDLAMIAGPDTATCLIVLPYWEGSSGVKIEMQVAEWCGKPVFYAHKTPYGIYSIHNEPVPAMASGLAAPVGQMSFEDYINSL